MNASMGVQICAQICAISHCDGMSAHTVVGTAFHREEFMRRRARRASSRMLALTDIGSSYLGHLSAYNVKCWFCASSTAQGLAKWKKIWDIQEEREILLWRKSSVSRTRKLIGLPQ